MPKIANFKNLVDELEASHDQMRQSIRRFDEDLCLKAGKDALILQREQLERTFIYKDDLRKIESQQDRVQIELNDIQENLRSWFEEEAEKQDNVMQTLIDNVLESKLSQYENVAKSFSKFFDSD